MRVSIIPTMLLASVLGILFLVLKLCGVLAWSWWIILLPWYIGPAAVFIIAFGFGTFALIGAGLGLVGLAIIGAAQIAADELKKKRGAAR